MGHIGDAFQLIYQSEAGRPGRYIPSLITFIISIPRASGAQIPFSAGTSNASLVRCTFPGRQSADATDRPVGLCELTPSGLFLVTLVQPLFPYSPPDVTCIRETRSNHRSAHVASTSISETTLGHNGGRGIPHKPTIARCPSSARRLPTTPCDHFGIISARRNRNHQGPLLHSFRHPVARLLIALQIARAPRPPPQLRPG